MKRFSISLPLLLAFFVMTFTSLFAKEKGSNSDGVANLSPTVARVTQNTTNRTLVNVGQVAMWIYSDGKSAIKPDGCSGLYFPRGNTPQTAAIFQDGLVWGGRPNDGAEPAVRVGGAQYNVSHVAGRIISAGVAENKTAPNVDRVWRVRRDFVNADLGLDAAEFHQTSASAVTQPQIDQVRAIYRQDWIDWPADRGAPFYDADGDGEYNPAFNADGTPKLAPVGEEVFDPAIHADEPGLAGGDQVVWVVTNDLDGAVLQSFGGSSQPIGLEQQIALWAYARADALGQVVFKRFRLIYKGHAGTPPSATISDMYVTQWSDPDVGNNGDDLAGSDTTLSLGYAYNNNAVDANYATAGLPPPASGYDFFAGPIVDAPGQTGIFDLKIVQDKRNLPMTSFASFSAGAQASDPGTLGTFDVTLQWFNLMRGFLPRPADIVNPSPFIDPTTGLASKFTLSGDPITDSGWVDSGSGDRRILLSSGPFTMALGDTQDVVIAALAAIGTDRLSSVAVLKFTDRSAQEAFDLLFELPSPPAKPVAAASELENAIFLNWAVDGDAVALTEGLDANGFLFEGYNVYQLPSAGATKDDPQAVRLATFDVINNFTTITQEAFDIPTGQILNLPVQFGNNTGISRTLTVTSDAIRGLNLINGQTYFFGISAYSNNPDPAATLKSLESTLTILTVTPQSTKLGERLTQVAGNVLAVSHDSGASDGAVVPTVLDPASTVDANYQVTFRDVIDDSDPEHPVTVTVWDLTNTTSGEVLLADQTNQSGDADYLVTDGLQVVVSGPALNLLDWSWEAGTGEFGFTRWVTGGGGQGGEQFFEGAFLGPNFNGSGLAPGDYRSIFMQFFGMESFTDLNGNSQYDIGEPYQLREGAGQVATLVSGFGPGLRTGTAIVPFQAFDMDADPMRQLDIVIRDRDGNGQWDMTAQYEEGDPNFVANGNAIGLGGDFRFNYVNIYNTDYDATGANWDPAQGGQDPTIGAPDPIQMVLWMGDRGTGVLGGDFTMTFTAPKVNTTADVFSFTSTGPSFSESTAKQDAVELINVFPNPYLGVNRFEQNRFQRKVTFSHLPENAIIRIFNLAGILVRKLEKSNASQFAEWNMQNENGNPVASGIYVVNIEMPDLRLSKNLKLAIVVEETFLRRF